MIWKLSLLLMCSFLLVGPQAAVAQDKKLVVVPASGPLAGKTVYRNSYALLIGINDYPNLPPGLSLHYAVKDATDLRDVLVQSYGFPDGNVTLLTNEQATKRNIQDALDALTDSGKVGPDDRVLVFFSGHGQTVSTAVGGDMGFLVPEDAKVDLSAPDNIGPYNHSCLSMTSIRETLQSCPAKHVLLLADACYSGLLAQSKATEALRPEVVAAMMTLRARQVMTAGLKGETSTELSEYGHGAFTYKLLEQLKARASAPGVVFTATDLYDSLRTSVSNLTGAKQVPQLGNFDTEGDFLFITTPTMPLAVDATLSQYQLGVSLLSQKKYAEAASNLRLAVRAKPTNSEYQNSLGQSLALQKKYAEAEVCFREAVRLKPDNAKYQSSLGRSLCDQNKFADAEPVLREAIRLDPTNAAYQNNLGVALSRQGKNTDAEDCYREAIRIEPDNAMYQGNLGNTLRRQQKYAEAEPYLREAVRLDPTDAGYQANLGSTLENQQKYAEAEPYLRQAVRAEPANAERQENLGVALENQQKYGEAEPHLREAVRIEPTNAGYQDNLGVYLVSQNRYADAEARFREAVRIEPKNEDYQDNMGNVLFEQRKYAVAEHYYREAHRLKPGDANIQKNLDDCLRAEVAATR